MTPKYRPTRFCWWCGRKLWAGGKRRVVMVIEGFPRTLHKQCVREVFAKEKP